MRCHFPLTLMPLLGLAWSAATDAADLAYVGQADPSAARVAKAVRPRFPGLDRDIALTSIAAVAEAVRSGTAEDGLIPAVTPDGMPAATTDQLLATSDPGLRIVGEMRDEEPDGGPIDYWVIARPVEHWSERHPDRLVVTIESQAGSKTFSLVVAGLSKIGFTVTLVTAAPLGGKPFGFRYLVELAADKPVLVLRATDAIARDARAGGGHAVLIGAWQQVT